jgi:hypothetical protein
MMSVEVTVDDQQQEQEEKIENEVSEVVNEEVVGSSDEGVVMEE